MPYKVKNKCVYRKDTGKKVGCTKGDPKRYLRALYANEKNESMKLTEILTQVENEKNIFNSAPKREDMQRFQEVTNKLLGILKETKTVEKEVLHNKDVNGISNMFSAGPVVKVTMQHHLGEYNGSNFKNFTNKISKLYEKAGFIVEEGYGTDDINGFEVKNKEGQVLAEIDFLEKDAIPDMNNTIIIKLKKQ